MESKKLYFDVDSTQIDIKSILKKEFLELRMKAISTANPNRNNSWFTKESLLASKDSFKNKPILGYFENGDFVSHNGEWKEDPETNIDYWDTTEVKKGERPIGFIRESDEVEVVDDPETGLSWIVLSCALWTQYNYKQVKRLLKDAKKAKQNGGPAKNISVEVDITDWEDLDNGVMKINAFNLVGITILGSRNGVKVEPGIEDAELSVVDIMGTALYEKQMQSLRLAYEKLDGSEKNNKEDVSTMLVNENKNVIHQNAEGQSAAAEEKPVEEVVTSVDENGSSQDAHFEGNAQKDPEQQPESGTIHENEEQDHGDDDEDEDADEDEVCPECGKNPCECEKHEHEEAAAGEHANEEAIHQNEESQEPIQDITWLLDRISGFASSMECCMNYYINCADCIEGSDYIIPVLKRVYGQTIENEKELIGLLAKVAEGISAEEKDLAVQLSENYDCRKQYALCNELTAKCEELGKQCEELKCAKEELECKFAEIEKAENHKQFMKEAKEMIASAKFSEELTAAFEKSCEEGKYASLNELKTQIGVKLFELKTKEEAPVEEHSTFDAPINNPDTLAFTNDKTKVAKKDKWATLRENNEK